MHGIILETSSNSSFILLTRGTFCLARLPLEGGSVLSKNLGSDIQNLLKKNPEFKADYIAVGTGPGSYTGTRVGTALAKALSFGWKIPLLGFYSLKAFLPQNHQGDFAILSDAKMGSLYCLMGHTFQNTTTFKEPELLPISSVITKKIPLFSFCPATLLKNSEWNLSILPTELNIPFLTSLCFSKSNQQDRTPISLIYLDRKTQNPLG